MCGIAGFTRFHSDVGSKDTLIAMGNSIAHRGPDSQGTYIDAHIGLCHQRLSIIDLSSAGNQPMFSDDENLVIVFNGEIYNFPELREDLIKLGYNFHTHTDTEVILALYKQKGPECLSMLNGMFAIAIWDKTKEELFLARDRLGKKPLYYYDAGEEFIFASEIKAILEVECVKKEIRVDALYDFFTYQYIPDPKTIFKDMFKLEPGHWMLISKDSVKGNKYWDISFSKQTTQSETEIQTELFELLESSVKQRMLSDVPLGAFLSGGVDSSAVVGLMAAKDDAPVTTCSIGFDSKKHDEVEFAQIVADRFATDHHEFTVKENFIEHIEEIVSYFDEPFADPSLIPTYFVSKLAREKVTVALAGDGGDESFAGYEKYSIDNVENKLRNLFPSIFRRTLFPSLAKLFENSNNIILKKGHTLLDTLSQTPQKGFFLTNAFCTDLQWKQLANKKLQAELGDYHPSSITEYHYHRAGTEDHLSRILYADIKTYLPGDILVKVDRMSMANSLEVRAPLLDYKIVEFAANIPSHLKFHNGEKKHILKETVKKILPDEILYRKKMGFDSPLAAWLKDDIRDFTAEKLFGENSGISQFFDVKNLKSIWQQHQNDVRDHSSLIWSFLMFELWWQKYMANG